MFFARKKTDRNRRSERGHKAPPAPATHHLEQFVVEEVELAGDARRATGGGPVHKARPAWFAPARIAAGWTSLWLILVLAPLISRSVWPPDETRLLAVVWQMWTRNDLIVPMFNGALVSQPSILQVWLIQLGWWAFGVNDWWPRLLPGFFSLGSMFLGASLARYLWPGRVAIARYFPGILLGGFFWALYSTCAYTGMPLVFFTLLAAYALAWTWRGRDLRVWLLLGLALGLGALSQGAMIYLYILPLALLAPMWANEGPKPNWEYWYADIAKACLMSLMIFGVWAVPLAMRSGALNALHALFVPFAAQSVSLFPADTPWWWYLFLLPVLGLPWSVWPLTWLRLWHIRRERTNAGMVFCIAWSVPAVAVLSLFSVRQPQFLLPLVPAFALVVAYLLLDEKLAEHEDDSLASTMIFPFILLGGGLAVLPALPRVDFLPDALWSVSPFVGIAIVLVGMMLAFLPIPEVKTRLANMVSAVVVVCALVMLGIGWQFNPVNDASTVATVLVKAQDEQRALAIAGPYAGEFDLAARLAQSMQPVDADTAGAWLAEHPRGLLLTFTHDWQPPAAMGLTLAYEVPYDNQAVRLWAAPAESPASGAAGSPPAAAPAMR